MAQYVRRPTPVEAYQWFRDSDPRGWPEWMRLYKANDTMGQLAGIGPGGVGGTLQVPGGKGNAVAETGDWLVFEGEVVDDGYGSKTLRGTVTVYKPAQFAEDFVEALGETPAGDEAQTEAQPS